MNVFCFLNSNGQTCYVPTDSIEGGINILKRLGIDVKTTDYIGHGAILVCTSGQGVVGMGNFALADSDFILTNDNGEIV